MLPTKPCALDLIEGSSMLPTSLPELCILQELIMRCCSAEQIILSKEHLSQSCVHNPAVALLSSTV